MNNKEALCKLYSDILKLGGCVSDEKGNIFINLGTDQNVPLTVDGKRLLLPTEENLKSNDTNTLIFHPLAKSIIKQESPIIIRLRKAINIRLNTVTALLARCFLEIMSSTDKHKNLQPEQLDLVTKLSNIDAKALDVFVKKFISGAGVIPDKNFIFIFIKRRAIIKELNDKGVDVEKIYSRGGIVSFPFYEKLNEDSDNLRVKDKKAFKDIFEYIFTDINHTDFYNQGSSSRQAPTLLALLKTAVNIASILNDHIEKFKNFIPDYEDLLFDLDFYEFFNRDDSEAILEKLVISVPPQHDSGGIIADTVKSIETKTPEQTKLQPQEERFKNFNNPAQPTNEVVKNNGKLNWDSIVSTNENVARTLNKPMFDNRFQPQVGYQHTQARKQPGVHYNNNSNNSGYFGGGGFGSSGNNRKNLI